MSTKIDAPADDITLPALKPCPFCGAPGHLSTVTGWSSVGCSGFQSCPAYLRAQVHTTPEAAVAVWNNRPAILADRAVQMGTADHNAREMIARFRKAVFEAGAGDDSPENFGEVIDAQTALFAALAPPSPVPAAGEPELPEPDMEDDDGNDGHSPGQLRAYGEAMAEHATRAAMAGLTDDDSYALIGEAAFMRGKGLVDMPAFLEDLAARLFEARGMTVQAQSYRAMRAAEQAAGQAAAPPQGEPT